MFHHAYTNYAYVDLSEFHLLGMMALVPSSPQNFKIIEQLSTQTLRRFFSALNQEHLLCLADETHTLYENIETIARTLRAHVDDDDLWKYQAFPTFCFVALTSHTLQAMQSTWTDNQRQTLLKHLAELKPVLHKRRLTGDIIPKV